jgi:hypothetical protein
MINIHNLNEVQFLPNCLTQVVSSNFAPNFSLPNIPPPPAGLNGANLAGRVETLKTLQSRLIHAKEHVKQNFSLGLTLICLTAGLITGVVAGFVLGSPVLELAFAGAFVASGIIGAIVAKKNTEKDGLSFHPIKLLFAPILGNLLAACASIFKDIEIQSHINRQAPDATLQDLNGIINYIKTNFKPIHSSICDKLKELKELPNPNAELIQQLETIRSELELFDFRFLQNHR